MHTTSRANDSQFRSSQGRASDTGNSSVPSGLTRNKRSWRSRFVSRSKIPSRTKCRSEKWCSDAAEKNKKNEVRRLPHLDLFASKAAPRVVLGQRLGIVRRFAILSL